MNARFIVVFTGALLLATVGLIVARRPAPSAAVPPATVERQAPSSAKGRGSMRPRLPAPRLPAFPGSSEGAAEPPATNTIARLLKGEEMPKLSRA